MTTKSKEGYGVMKGEIGKNISLSEYLHGKLEVVLDNEKTAEEKITVIEQFHDFLKKPANTNANDLLSNESSSFGEEKNSDTNLHLPLIADRYLTFRPSKTDGKDRERKNAIQCGIQLPSINWQAHFRKGYSLLMWIRIHPPEKILKKSAPATVGAYDSHVLYRFATSKDKSARGIQATLHGPKSSSEHPPNPNYVNIALRVEALSPKGYKVPNALSSSRALITPLTLPLGTWTLLGIQHYLPGILQNKRPVLAVHVDGDEVFRDEMILPVLGNDVAEVMSDNYLLCNIPNRHTNLPHNGLRIERLDLASVGLYKDVIPGYMQGIVSEYGPCVTSDGVVPVIPPVAQCRDAVIMSAEGRVKSDKKNTFGLKVNQRNGNGVAGRGVGVPLSKGLLLNSDGNVTGDVHVQKFLSKLVLGLNSSNALVVGEKRVIMKITTGCSIGMTGDVPKIGICQPKLPLGNAAASALSPFGDQRTDQGDLGTGNFFANCSGDITLTHSTDQFQKMEKCLTTGGLSHYEIPSTAPDVLPIPSFLLTYISIDPLAYILQPFHLALPSPGHTYSLQLLYYRRSFDHLYDLIVYRDGALAAHLIKLLAANITMGGEMREQILQSGGLHTFSNLLRRVLLRAGHLGMLTSTTTSTQVRNNVKKETLWKIYSAKETSEDDIADGTSSHNSSPAYIPPLITQACCSVIRACCGPVLMKENKDQIAQHIRRTSDLALTAVFGLTLDLDLWGSDNVAAASILREVVVRYCSTEEINNGQHNLSNKHDNGYGWLLRGQMTVQYVLDIIRLHFSKDNYETERNDGSNPCMIRDKATTSVASSFSSILYTMLKYSLSSNRSTFRGEHDIASAVAALSDCPLGSIGAHVVLSALRNILVYCEIINITEGTIPPLSPSETDERNETQAQHPKNIIAFLQSVSSPPSPKKSSTQGNQNEESLKLIRIKSDMASRLSKNLLMARFHDVVGPMLLSRTVFDWRRAMIESNAVQMRSKKQTVRKTAEVISTFDEESTVQECEIKWQYHWRLALNLFTWLASIAGAEGEIAAKSTGSLLFHSGKAGSLTGCLLGRNKHEGSFFNALLVPPLPPPYESRIGHTNDLSHRFRIMMHLLGGLVVSLTSDVSHNNFVTRKDNEPDCRGKEDKLLSPAVVDTLTSLIGSVTTTLRYLHSRGGGSLGSSNHETRRQHKVAIGNGAMNQMSVKAAKEAVPPLLIAAALLNEPIQKFLDVCSDNQVVSEHSTEPMVNVTVSNPSMDSLRNLKNSQLNLSRTDSDVSWVDVTPSKVDFSDISCQPLISLEEQLRALKACEERLLNSAGIIILNAMAVGGGEASTLVWRVVVSALASCCPILPKTEDVDSKPENSILDPKHSTSTKDVNGRALKHVPYATNSLDKTLLCRLAAMVLNGVLSRQRSTKGHLSEDGELCSATARLCDLVEEKELLRVPFANSTHSSSSRRPRFSSVQVHLLCALLDVMENGRNQTGWCQLLSNTQQGLSESNLLNEKKSKKGDTSASVHETPSLLDASINGEETNVLLVNDELYHQEDASKLYEPFPPPPAGGIQSRTENQSRAQTQTVSSSKILLPILQPSLRIILSCLGQVQSKAMVIGSQIASGTHKSLLSKIIEELHSTLTAAIVGLTFSNARDVCLNSLSCLRKATKIHKQTGDLAAVSMCNALVVAVIDEMRVRYLDERNRRENEQHMSFLIGHDTNGIESLLVGNALIDRSIGDRCSEIGDEEAKAGEAMVGDEGSHYQRKGSESDDFILFAQHDDDTTQKPAGLAMGWSNYRGFGVALEKCHQSSLSVKNLESSRESTEVEHHADKMLDILSSYLDTWDAKQTQDDAESELVELFGENTNLTEAPLQQMTSVVSGSETAADSMSSYIELSSSENSRIADIQHSILPSRRYNRMAFAERSSWKYFMIFSGNRQEYDTDFFERCMSDGGLDYGARIVTTPIHPQFPRHIPRQLDHSILQSNTSCEGDIGDERGLNSTDQYNTVDIGEIKTLVERGDLKIVDVTKKQDVSLEDDDIDGSVTSDNVLVSKPSMEMSVDMDGDSKNLIEEASLEFPERSEDNDGTCDETDNGVDDGSGLPIKDSASFSMNDQGSPTDGNNNHHNFIMSSFADPPNGLTSCLRSRYMHQSNDIGFSAGGGHGFVDLCFDNCLQIKAQGSRSGTLFLTQTFLIFEYADSSGLLDGEALAIEEKKKRLGDELASNASPNSVPNVDTSYLGEECKRFEQQHKKSAAVRPKSLRWNISELSHVYLRRYRLRDSALELFFLPSGGSAAGGNTLLSALSSVFLDFGPGRVGNENRDDAANAIMKRAPAQTVKQWPEKSGQVLHEQLRNYMKGWMTGRISNFDYLLSINCLAGRSFNDLCQYPVFPWVLSNYTSEEIPDLTDKSNFRDLTKPMGALNPDRLQEFVERFETFQDAVIPPFMYGSHYSTSAGVVLHFLVRMHPFAGLHRQLQGGHFDVADRLFSSVARTWDMCTGVSAAEVKELTPEWYCNPSFLRNINNLKLGTSQDGELLGDVTLPPWAKGSPEKFVEVLRCALESDICSDMLPNWIDLIFGRKQQGPAAVEAHNVFFYLTYYGSVDVASLEDEDLRAATELQIAHFGQCPMQLFWRPHLQKAPKNSVSRRASLSEMLKLYEISEIMSQQNRDSDIVVYDKPFQSAPLSHWAHLYAPPPGPHAPLVAVRMAGPDRCLAIDAQGIIHCFRWTWKADIENSTDEYSAGEVAIDVDSNVNDLFGDKGCFVTQRELPHFRSVPRLRYSPPNTPDKKWSRHESCAVVAISKSLFAARTLLLVLSDGDGRGSLSMELVDPAKGLVKGQVLVPSIHSSKITAIHMDPMGIASGVGGVGGELAIVGSQDGTATLWRFISSQFLPLRPRLRLGGHRGAKINAVAVNSSLNICVTVSDLRCCIFNMGNGVMLHSLSPPSNTSAGLPETDGNKIRVETIFAHTNAVCVASGHIVLVCKSKFLSNDGVFLREVVTLQLYTVEGIHLGSKAFESWRGVPRKVWPTFDGRAVMVCSGRGISIHMLSAVMPLCFVDEWQIADDSAVGKDNELSVYDVDYGPSPSRPVVVVASCSSGALRLHALKGISSWSEEHRKGSMTEAVGNALAKPALRLKNLVGNVKGTGSKVVGFGKEISREALSDVKAKGSGLFNDVFRKK